MSTETLAETSDSDLEVALDHAADAADSWAQSPASDRATILRAIADGLDAAGPQLVPTAEIETNLTSTRLRNELVRTTFQLRFFADLISSGEHLAATIDHADPSWGMGPRPDIRRINEPVGPVLVFAASNFPFAFSVAGGDTAAALAAGCPVIVKAHPGHPLLSMKTGDVVRAAVRDAGGPDGLLTVISGLDAGRKALLDRRIRAASFTGSIPGGRALFDLANTRPDPIPFYGELGSVNPVFVTVSAARSRGAEIVEGYVSSFTLGAGQFCTKPGVLFVPAGDGLIEQLTAAQLPGAAPLLNARIQAGFVDALDALLAHQAVQPLATDGDRRGDPPTPTIVRASIDDVLADPEHLLTEVFGPATLVVEYDDERRLLQVAALLEGQLTATVQGSDDDEIAPELIRALATKAGRVLWNQWPTGVTVSYAQQHGGPYPATTAPTTTAVGAAAIYRFLRPVAYQGLPQHLLPAALRDDNPLGIAQRVNG